MRKLTIYSLYLFAAIACFILLSQWLGIKINHTVSIPLGFYIETDKKMELGDYVLVCPPNTDIFRQVRSYGYIGSGSCPHGFEMMMKKIAAVPGDEVRLSGDGVFVNGRLLPLSKPLERDLSGRTIPSIEFQNSILEDGKYLLMSGTSEISFDSRYFGPLDKSNLLSVIRPLFVW